MPTDIKAELYAELDRIGAILDDPQTTEGARSDALADLAAVEAALTNPTAPTL